MFRYFKKTVIFAFVLVLTGCQRTCESFDRSLQLSDRQYTIVKLGCNGDTIFYRRFVGIVNNSEHSDGIYWTENGRLFELGGDYIVTSTSVNGDPELVKRKSNNAY